MRPKKYPLDPLVRVRKERVDASVAALAKSIRAREVAEDSRAVAEAERLRAAEEAKRTRGNEAEALARGELSAADLQRQASWQARTQWDDAERARRVVIAREQEARALEAERGARAGASDAEAAAKVVTKHREGWVSDSARALEASSEEGAAEAWRRRG
jgi:hypothetical protein